MKTNTTYIKTIVIENCPKTEKVEDYVQNELSEIPESFDCFFEESWDELNDKEQSKRIEFLLNIFK